MHRILNKRNPLHITQSSPPANFDPSQRLPQHSQRWCLEFLRHILIPHHSINSHKSPPSNFDPSQRPPQRSQRSYLDFLRYVLKPHQKQIFYQEFWTLYLLGPGAPQFLETSSNPFNLTPLLQWPPPQLSAKRGLTWIKTLLFQTNKHNFPRESKHRPFKYNQEIP